MSMTCLELVDSLLDYVGGELDPAARELLVAHLDGCNECLVTVEMYQATITVAGALKQCDPDYPLPDGLEARLRAAVAAGPG